MKKALLVILFIFSLFLIGCKNDIVTVKYKNGDSYLAGTTEVGLINELEIEWVCGKIVICETDSSKLTFNEINELEDTVQNKIHYLLNDNKLTLKFSKNGSSFDINKDSKDLYISIPTNYELSKITIDTINSNVDIKNINSSEYDIDVTSGYVSLDSNNNIDKLNINSVSANINLKTNIIKDTYIDTKSGTIDILANYIKKIAVDSISGTFKMNGLCDTIICKTTSASIEYTGSIYKEFDFATTSGNVMLTNNSCCKNGDVDTSTGVVTLNFNKDDVFTCKCISNVGNINVTGEYVKDNNNYIFNSKDTTDIVYTINTITGDITINLV